MPGDLRQIRRFGNIKKREFRPQGHRRDHSHHHVSRIYGRDGSRNRNNTNFTPPERPNNPGPRLGQV